MPGISGYSVNIHLQPAIPGFPTSPHRQASSAVGDLPPLCGIIAHVPSSNNPHSSFGGRGIPLSLLATSLPTMTGMATIPRLVVDQTGLVGLYDFTLHWNGSPDPDTGDTVASFREALKSHLGLELKPTQAPIDILVIDRVQCAFGEPAVVELLRNGYREPSLAPRSAFPSCRRAGSITGIHLQTWLIKPTSLR
jgi:hypothetical protein